MGAPRCGGLLQAKGVITASAGNHAQGVAMSAARLGVSAIVAMPTATPSIKVSSVSKCHVRGRVKRRSCHRVGASTLKDDAKVDSKLRSEDDDTDSDS